MPLLGHHASGPWSIPIPLTFFLVLFAVVYLWGWSSLRSAASTAIPAWRAASFLVGLALIWAALGSPLAMLDEHFLTAHMLKHLLLMTIAPALLLLASPFSPILHGLPQRFVQSILVPMARTPLLHRIGKFFANPVVCWLAATAALVAWHIPAIFASALASPVLHHFEHFTFIAAGTLFWWPVIKPWGDVPNWSGWPILLYLFLATIPCDILSAYLTFCDRVVYLSYLDVPNGSLNSVLQDQQLAGALMWTCITVIYLVPAVALTVQLLQRPSRPEILQHVEQKNLRPSPDSSRTT
jgi:putative membrane protein